MTAPAIFDTCADSEFFGHEELMDYIAGRASAARPAPGMLLVGGRWMGKTEVLRRVHAGLFAGQAAVAPVYYRFRRYGAPAELAGDYLGEVARQYLAFRTGDAALAAAVVPLARLERMVSDGDEGWGLAGPLRRFREAVASGDEAAALKVAVTAPDVVSRAGGVPLFMILDDIDNAGRVEGGAAGRTALGAFLDSLAAGSFAFVASTYGGLLDSPALDAGVEVVRLEGLDPETSVLMMAELCKTHRVEFTTELLRFLARRLDGCPAYMRAVVRAAARPGRSLSTARAVAGVYADEVASGGLAMALRSALALRGVDELRVAHAAAHAAPRGPALTTDECAAMLNIDVDRVEAIAARLSGSGFLDNTLGAIVWAGGHVETSFIDCAYGVRVGGMSAEEAKTRMAGDLLKDAYRAAVPRAVGAFSRGRFAPDCRELLASFDGQTVAVEIFRNRGFSGEEKDGIYSNPPAGEKARVRLPQVIGCYEAGRWERGETGPPVLLAHGYQSGRYDPGNEVVWAVFVKEGASPATVGDVSGFARRAAALRNNFRTTRMVLWMVSEEGFTAEAAEQAASSGVYASSSSELRALRDAVTAGDAGDRPAAVPEREYEVVLPPTARAELVAARAAEEITTAMGFDDSAIGAVKTALVEACINAFEHGRSRAGRVYLRFVTTPEGLEIQVENPGMPFHGTPGDGAAAASGPKGLPRKRGWGIELMRKLMDSVRFEGIRGGTRIVMVKYLSKGGSRGDGAQA